MEKKNLPRNVCELLAQQLVTEQAALVRQEAVVEVLTQQLRDKKKELIRECLSFEMFKFKDKKMIATRIVFREDGDRVIVGVWFAESPESCSDERECFTRQEKALFDEYQKAFEFCRLYLDEEHHDKIQEIAEQLNKLKPNLKLTRLRCWSFRNDDFTSPDFFKNSGLYLNNLSSSGDPILIEQLVTGE